MTDLICRISNLLKKFGIKSITMDDIAGELGISKKTLYQHFKNKKDVIYKVVQFEIKCERIELDKLCSMHSNAINQLLFITRHTLKKFCSFNSSSIYCFIKYHPQIWERVIFLRKEYLCKLIKRNFKIGMKQGLYRNDLNSDIISVFYTLLLDIKGFEMYENNLNGNFDMMFNTLFNYHIHAISNIDGIKYYRETIQQKH